MIVGRQTGTRAAGELPRPGPDGSTAYQHNETFGEMVGQHTRTVWHVKVSFDSDTAGTRSQQQVWGGPIVELLRLLAFMR